MDFGLPSPYGIRAAQLRRIASALQGGKQDNPRRTDRDRAQPARPLGEPNSDGRNSTGCTLRMASGTESSGIVATGAGLYLRAGLGTAFEYATNLSSKLPGEQYFCANLSRAA